MVRLMGYNEIISENFDLQDNYTRKVLLSINEADQNAILQSLTSKLYNDIVDKVDDIDFGTITQTEGDITKIQKYDKLIQCLTTMKDILIQYREDTEPVDTIFKAIDNIKDRKDVFERGFKLKIELPSLIYATTVLAIVSSTSFMISSCIEYIKEPNTDSFVTAIDKVALIKTKSNLLFNNLRRFNAMCSNGDLDKTLEYVIKSNIKNFTGFEFVGVVLAGGVAVCIIRNIIPLLRELIFFFYYSRTNISDYFEVQSELLQMNSYNLDTSINMQNRNKSEINNIKNKQLKIADKFKKIANFFAIKGKESEVNTNKDIKNSSKKYKLNDVVDSEPDSANISTSLF